jgi:P22 coat protein - gene protein 5
MTQTLLTPDTIAAEGLIQLENALVMGNLVYRDYQTEWTTGFKKGSTVRIRRPVNFTVTDGATATIQDVEEGNTSVVVNNRKHVAFQFPTQDLTLSIENFSERYIKPAAIQLANQVDVDLLTEGYKRTYNWVGTPGQTINSFSDFAKGPERLDVTAVPKDQRYAVLSPPDYWGMVGGFGNGANFFQPELAKTAIEKARLPMLGGVEAFMTQNVVNHTVGAFAGTPITEGVGSTTYAAVMSSTTWSMDLLTDGWNTVITLKAGDVFTISGVNAVNWVTKANLGYLQQFTIIQDVVTANPSSSDTTIKITPPIITSGPYQTVSQAAASDTTITYMGTASTAYAQNLVFHKNAFALAMVPLELPGGAAKKSRFSKNGLSIRVIEDYDFTNDLNGWRFDILYGVKTLDNRLATRLSGTA